MNKFIKWSNTLKQIVGKLPTICLSVFDHFSGLALKGLNNYVACNSDKVTWLRRSCVIRLIMRNATNQTDYAVKFYGRKSD